MEKFFSKVLLIIFFIFSIIVIIKIVNKYIITPHPESDDIIAVVTPINTYYADLINLQIISELDDEIYTFNNQKQMLLKLEDITAYDVAIFKDSIKCQ